MCFGANVEETFNGVNERLEKSKIAANPKTATEFGHVQAGRKGEDLVQKELEKLGKVRQGVRIPGTANRYEIDLVLEQRNHIYLFEVKNWSGQVDLTPNGEWRQIRGKNSVPPEIIHENALEKHRHKAVLFREKMGLPKDKVSCFVVFPKDNLKLTYGIGREPEVLSAPEFRSWVHRQTPSPVRVFSELVLPKSWTGFDDQTSDKIKESMGDCGTWDLVYLEGGRVLQGDYRAGPGKLNRINRAEIATASLAHTRNRFIGGIKAVFGHEPTVEVKFYPRKNDALFTIMQQSSESFECTIDSVICFRKAGDKIDSKVRLNEITRIEFSSK